MLDAVVEFDEGVMERYLGGETLEVDEIKRSIRLGAIAIENYPGIFVGRPSRTRGFSPYWMPWLTTSPLLLIFHLLKGLILLTEG